jgi:predicted nucleotidyltransferase
MAVDIKTVNRAVEDYVSDVRKIMNIDKAYLYGSYAKGTYDEYSDVDICFFSSEFEGQREVDILTKLLGIARSYRGIGIEPQAFPTSEIDRGNPFVREVIRTGREIPMSA